MKLSAENIQEIRDFFNNKELSELFIELFNYQAVLCEDIEFVNRNSIIGFGRENEHLRCYVGKSSSNFFLKIKTCNESVEFRKKDFEEYKVRLLANNVLFSLSPEKYTLMEKAPKVAKKKSRKSQEKTNKVLAKLKNRNKAKKFTLEEFNDLADWTYCDSFNDDGYVYTLSNGNQIECDSKSEVKLLDYLTSKKLAVAIGGQSLRIQYSSAFRSGLDYYPDIVILTKDMHIAIIEVKPVTAMSNHRNIEKYEALTDYCTEHGYEYMMVDPDHDYMTFDDMQKLHVPSDIVQRVDDYLVNLIGSKGECLLEKDDIPILYEDFSDEYKKGDFELYLHALVIQKGWYNRFTHGFMVYEEPNSY